MATIRKRINKARIIPGFVVSLTAAHKRIKDKVHSRFRKSGKYWCIADKQRLC